MALRFAADIRLLVGMDFRGWAEKSGRAFAGMPTHVMRPHEWGTRFCGASLMWANRPHPIS